MVIQYCFLRMGSWSESFSFGGSRTSAKYDRSLSKTESKSPMLSWCRWLLSFLLLVTNLWSYTWAWSLELHQSTFDDTFASLLAQTFKTAYSHFGYCSKVLFSKWAISWVCFRRLLSSRYVWSRLRSLHERWCQACLDGSRCRACAASWPSKEELWWCCSTLCARPTFLYWPVSELALDQHWRLTQYSSMTLTSFFWCGRSFLKLVRWSQLSWFACLRLSWQSNLNCQPYEEVNVGS